MLFSVITLITFVMFFLLRADLGHSARTSKPVATELRDALPVTLSLVIGGIVLCLLIAFPIGLLSALRPRSLIDRGVILFILIAISCQPFWLGLMLSYLLGVRAHASRYESISPSQNGW